MTSTSAWAAAPVAADDSYATTEGQTLIVSAPGVLANDSDADEDTLTAVQVSAPLYGTLTLNADGSFTYAPEADYYGTDSFSYEASGGGQNSAGAMVTLTVTASMPGYGGGGGQYSSGGGGGYGGGGVSALTLLWLLAGYLSRGLKVSNRRAISP